MTTQTDLRDATIEMLTTTDVVGHDEMVELIPMADADAARVADAILSLLARWECKEPGDCPE